MFRAAAGDEGDECAGRMEVRKERRKKVRCERFKYINAGLPVRVRVTRAVSFAEEASGDFNRPFVGDGEILARSLQK